MTNPVKSGAVIFAADIERVARFYEGAVSMAIAGREDGAIRLENETIQLVIHALPPGVAGKTGASKQHAPRTQAAVKLVFAVESLARVRSMAAGLGGGMAPAASAFVWAGFRACDGHDPEGNVIQFREAA